MDRPNPDAGKSVVEDVDSEDEIDEIKREHLPLKKKMWLQKADNYSRIDPEFQKIPRRTH